MCPRLFYKTESSDGTSSRSLIFQPCLICGKGKVSRQSKLSFRSTIPWRVQRRIAEQIVDTPALPDVEPVFIACRRGADRRPGLRVTCRRGNAGWRLSPRVAIRRGTKACTAGTDSCVYALWMPRDRGKLRGQLVEVPKIEQRTFEQLQVVDVHSVQWRRTSSLWSVSFLGLQGTGHDRIRIRSVVWGQGFFPGLC